VASGATIRPAAAVIALDNETARRWLRATSSPVTALMPVDVVAGRDEVLLPWDFAVAAR